MLLSDLALLDAPWLTQRAPFCRVVYIDSLVCKKPHPEALKVSAAFAAGPSTNAKDCRSNECKRRKIKCNGGSPCQRCGNLGVECLYSALCCANNFRESAEYQGLVANIKALEEQMKAMHQALNALQSGGSVAAAAAAAGTSGPSTTISSSLSPASSIPSLHRGAVDHALKPAAPGFRGPTSATFSLDVAKNTLRTMGYDSVGQTSDEAALAGTNDGAGLDDQPPQPPQQSLQQQPGSASASLRLDPHIQLRQVPRDPLWDFDKDEMVRLCRLHEEEVGVMYPVVNIETVIAHAKNLATAMENAAKATRGGTPSVPAQSGWPDPEEMLNDEKTHQLKGVMCCALLVEEHGHSEKAAWLFESVRPVADRRLMSDPADVATLPFLALVAGYHFLSNDEVLAWRVMGQVTRLCLELGLHRRDAIMNIPDAADRENAIITFWSAYVLDRRWSFATGLPYVVQDNEVDPNLPMPVSLSGRPMSQSVTYLQW